MPPTSKLSSSLFESGHGVVSGYEVDSGCEGDAVDSGHVVVLYFAILNVSWF